MSDTASSSRIIAVLVLVLYACAGLPAQVTNVSASLPLASSGGPPIPNISIMNSTGTAGNVVYSINPAIDGTTSANTTTTGSYGSAATSTLPGAPYTFATTPPNWTTGPNRTYLGYLVSLGATFPATAYLQDNERISSLASTIVVNSAASQPGAGVALDGYAMSKSTTTNVIAILGTGEAGVELAPYVFGGNLVASTCETVHPVLFNPSNPNGPGTNTTAQCHSIGTLEGLELDSGIGQTMGTLNTVSNQYGLVVYALRSEGQGMHSTGVLVNSSQPGECTTALPCQPWKIAYESGAGAATTGLYLGPVQKLSNQASQTVELHSVSSLGLDVLSDIALDLNGVESVTVPSNGTSGFDVLLSGAPTSPLSVRNTGTSLAPLAATSGTPTLLTITGPPDTGLTNAQANDVHFALGRTVTFAGSGTVGGGKLHPTGRSAD